MDNIEEKVEDVVEEKDLNLIVEIFKAMTKTVKAFTTYPPNNPIYQKFSDELFEKFNSFFELHEDLPLKVEQFSLIYKDKKVFQSTDRNDNMALMLFIDGIREVCFHKGLTLSEIIDIINVLRGASKGDNLDDDVVTLLWEKDMEHFTYFVPETVGEEDLNIPADTAAPTGEGGTTITGASYSDISIRPVSLDLRIPPPSDEDIALLREKLHALEGDNLLSSALELFFDMLKAEKETEGFAGIAKNIGMIMDIYIERDMLNKVIELLNRLQSFTGADIIAEHKKSIESIIDKAGSEKALRELLKGKYDPEVVRGYLLSLSKSAIRPLLNILGDQEDRRVRRLICNMLAVIGKQDIKAVAEGLKEKRWYLVRNTLFILGMMKEPSAIKYIEESVRHPELRVRREAIKILETAGTPDVKNSLIVCLKDADQAIRISAIKALRRLKGSIGFEVIKEIVLGEDFKEKPFSEKKELLETLAELNKNEAFPILAGFLRRKGLFKKIKNKELAACAAYGLGIIGTEDAMALMEHEKDSKDSLLREACRKALRIAGKK
ncbi:MAG: HEAT repeat domain-containing protein [Nitrospirae bacterium]|nr:HEAT repeat domain-containing protein [Nitrospirota bacterium]